MAARDGPVEHHGRGQTPHFLGTAFVSVVSGVRSLNMKPLYHTACIFESSCRTITTSTFTGQMKEGQTKVFNLPSQIHSWSVETWTLLKKYFP